MGVPKFYRWISERYPCLSEVVKEYQVPEFDNLYLDMNGIIHVCSHPNDDDPHFRITEEQIFKDIFHYIEVLFRIVCPRKVFFMAVDGVAPRAKMNQQRGRRFRSAKEAEENIKKALKKGEILPDEKRFDSNCITPGTKFMVRLQDELEYMVQSKISNDPSWQGISVYLSGHETPGEGEHKIMEFIRHERSQPEYDPNTRHCLYGLDADLMMLGLCSHEPHFSLLREEVRFTGKKSKNSRTAKPEETTFHLLHLSLMREYIEHEFDCLKNKLPFKFNLESIIDDWVLMGFLVGNDFIPHLPHLHIAHNALPMLYQTYKQVLPHLDGYLNDGGIVNLERFERYLVTLSEFDREKFGEQFDDLRWLESKTRKGKMGVESDSKGEIDSLCSLEEKNKSERENNLSHVQNKAIQVVKELSLSQGLISPDSECESNGSQDDSTFETEFQMFKRHYYQEKLHIEASDGVVAKIVYEYILAIQWICHYYYNGVQSWSWYYPYHYAPFLSDLCHLGRMKLHFSMETPFLPYQQLLAVLPAASKECLPEPYWDLMCSEHSPIIDYYPTEFQCDLNGKQQEWEAVVLIPFINEKRLLDAMKSREKKLTASEKARNRHSPCLLYQFDSNVDVFVKSSLPGTFPDIVHCKSRCDTIPLHAWNSGDTSRIVKGLLSGCRLSVYYPGFPTLYHISHTCYLKKQGVKVFQMPSKNENMILQILSPNYDEDESQFVGVFEGQSFKKGESLDDVAKNLLGCSIYVNWPHMEEAKVVAVSDGDVKYEVTEHIQGDGAKESKQKMHRKTLTDSECQTFDQDVDVIVETYMSRRGIKIGRTNFVVYAQPLLGRKYVCGRQGLITLEKQWAVKPQVYALQTTVKDIAVKDPTFRQFKGIEELFPVDSAVFMLGHPNYGCQGKVLSVHKGMTTVELETPVEPDIESVIKRRKKLSSTYYPGWVLASRIGISGYLLSRITGTIYVFYPTTRKWQLGLNLRFSKENSGIAGYTKVENREWSYSEAVAEILREYWEKFPEILSYLQSALNKNESDFDAAKMVKSDDVIGKLQEVSTWLKTLECYGGDKVNENSDMLELKVVQAINEKVQAVKKLNHETFQITIRPQDLYRPLAHQGTLLPDSNAQHKLLDRVVCVREAYTVPLGMRGAIIGIHKHPGQDILYDVFFDEEFLGGLKFGGRCPDRRGYRMPECTIINLSYGKRLEIRSQKPMAVVKPQNNYGVQQQRFPGSPKRKDRNIRSNKETKPQAKRPQSSPLSPAKPVSIMQRNSKSSSAKGQQNSNQHIFENLWNTLKLQNKSDNDASSSSHTAKALPNSSTVAKNAAAELYTKQNENFFNASLTQAAKTLPKVQLTSLSSKNNSNNAVRSTCNSVEVPSNLSSAVSTLPEPVVTVETTKTSEESALTNARASECNHLDQLFKSIKISKSQRLAFTPTQPCSSYHPPNFILPPSALPPRNYFSMQQGSTRPVIPSNIVMSPYAYPRHPHPRLYPNQWPPRFLNRPRPLQQMYRGITNTITHSSILPTNSTASINSPVISDVFSKQATDDRIDSMTFTSSKMQSQEGMQKLCEMLNTDKENEDASSSKWSLGEDDQDHVENEEGTEEVIEEESLEKKEETKSETYSLKDEASDGDSVKDEEDYMERSTSVEDEKTGIIQTKTKVDELMSLCKKCSMLPPIYTYFTTGDDQVVSTVQLWNGVRFSSHSQVNRDKAMEEAAQHAINYLKTEQQTNRPVSTSPPSTYSYIASSQDLVQAAASVGNPYFVQATPYAPVTYSPPQPAYFGYPLSSHNAIPISVLPRGPVIAMSGFQHPAVVPSYRFDQVQYLPPPQPQIIQVQHSPTHHPNKGLPVYHPPSGPPKPIMWNGGRPVGPCFDTYTLQNSAVFQQPAVPPPRTQYQLRDTPFIPLQVAKQQVKSDPTPVTATSLPPTPTKQEMSESKDTKKQKMPVKITPLKSATSSKSSKAKLAISFDSGKV